MEQDVSENISRYWTSKTNKEKEAKSNDKYTSTNDLIQNQFSDVPVVDDLIKHVPQNEETKKEESIHFNKSDDIWQQTKVNFDIDENYEIPKVYEAQLEESIRVNEMENDSKEDSEHSTKEVELEFKKESETEDGSYCETEEEDEDLYSYEIEYEECSESEWEIEDENEFIVVEENVDDYKIAKYDADFKVAIKIK